MERKVYLEGAIAKKFGSEFIIYAESVADVWRCLNCNFPELREYLMDCHEKDIGFLCQVGEKGLQDEEELLLSLGEGDIYISPQPAGSKSGLGKILAAIALVVVAIYAPYLFYGGFNGLAYTAASYGGFAGIAAGGLALGGGLSLLALGVAVNLALTGIQQMMAPDPSLDSPNTSAGENSYLFQGSEQTVLEGDPVPVAYGELRIPGRPIGFELRNKNNVYSSAYHNGGTGYTPGDSINYTQHMFRP